jgi:hypothetical protein
VSSTVDFADHEQFAADPQDLVTAPGVVAFRPDR